jgi:hypothetical protein
MSEKIWRISFFCNHCNNLHIERVTKDQMRDVAPLLLFRHNVSQLLIEDEAFAMLTEIQQTEVESCVLTEQSTETFNQMFKILKGKFK